MMILSVYHNKDRDMAALQTARKEAEAALSAVERLELATEFGRCIKCQEPLENRNDVLCPDCLDDMNPKKKPVIDISQYPRPGIYVDEPHREKVEPTWEQKMVDIPGRIERFNQMVEDKTILVRRRINIDYLTSWDVDMLWEYVRPE
jgi:hypothetical protein